MPLNPDIHQLLLYLENASVSGEEWIGLDAVQHIPGEQRDIAVRAGWVKEKGSGLLRQYKILPSGYTALGDNAEHAIRVIKGEAAPIPVIEPEVSVSLYGERMGEDAPAPRRARRSAEASTTCAVDGCEEPKYLTHSRCHAHMKAYWRDKAKENRVNKYAGKGKRAAAKSIAAPDSFVTIAAEEPPIDDDATQRDLSPVVDEPVVNTPPVSPLAQTLARAAVRGIVLLHRVKGAF